jgi:arylsulfatase A
MIEIMDKGIGELVVELDRLGIRENTLIIFSSDNGPAPQNGERSNQGLRGTKYTIYEGGIRVPFLFNWKGKLESFQSDHIVHFTDIFPTLVDICNLKLSISRDFEGASIARLLLGNESVSLPRHRFWQWNRGVPYYSHNAAMRNGKWKLVRPFVTRDEPDGPSDEKSVLYDLEDDPFEEEDVSGHHQAMYQYMNVMLEEWCREVEFVRLHHRND